MRRIVFVVVFMLAAVSAESQHMADWLALSSANESTVEAATRDLKNFTESLREPGPPTQRNLLKIFRKVHRAYLKKYEAYTDFNSLFSSGKYDCLTATMLLSQLLNELGYNYTIIETDYHIFMKVNTIEGVVLLESTDKLNGFVFDPVEISRRTEGYRSIVPKGSDPTLVSYRYRCKLYQGVSPENLTGLLYFNQAVKAYNMGDWLACSRLLEKGFQLYPSERCLELSDILVSTLVARQEISQEMRRASMDHLMPMLLHRSGKVATNGTD